MADYQWKPRTAEDSVDDGVHPAVAAMRLNGLTNAPQLSLQALRGLGLTPNDLGPKEKRSAISSPPRGMPKEDKNQKKKKEKKEKKKDKKEKKKEKKEKKKEKKEKKSSSSSGSSSDSDEGKKRKGQESEEATKKARVEEDEVRPVGEVDDPEGPPATVAALQAGDLSVLPKAIALLEGGIAEWQEVVAATMASLTPTAVDTDGSMKKAIAEAGAIPPLIRLLRASEVEVQKSAARALHNLTSKSTENKALVLESGALPPLIKLLKHGLSEVKEQVVCVLRNVSGGSPVNKKLVADGGVIPAVINQLKQSAPPQVQVHIAVILYNLANASSERKGVCIVGGAIPALIKMMGEENPSCQKEATDTLRILAHDTAQACMDIVAAGAAKPLATLLASSHPGVKKGAGQLRDTLAKFGGSGVKAALSSAKALP